MSEILSIVSTIIMILLIMVVYYNNYQIQELNNNAININQYIKKGEVNDDHIFKSNTNIVNYLKSRENMKQELELLKQTVKSNTDKNIEQDGKFVKNDAVDREQNRLINLIKDTYRSDMNYLVNLSFTEVQKHVPGISTDENLRMFRELLYKYVLLSLKDYNTILPQYKLDRFINNYGSDVAVILAESIYTYKIYNSLDKFPSITSIKDAIVGELTNEVKLNFLIKTYFPRMFNYIKTNSESGKKLFESIERSIPIFVSIASSDDFVQHIMTGSSIDLNKIDTNIKNFLFKTLPNYYTRNLYHNSYESSYVSEIDNNIILSTLNDCNTLRIFYDTWKLYNIVKPPDNTLFNHTQKTKLLKEMIDNNSIFKRIYIDKIKDYNTKKNALGNCNLPNLPITYKETYGTDEVK